MKKEFQFIGTSRLAIPVILAAFIGTGTGLLAVGFIIAIDKIRIFFFEGGAGPFGFLGPYFVVLLPAIGGLCIGPLVETLAPEAKGHGVPQVLKAIALRGGRIRPLVVVVKAVASAISIGSGASVGREGPIVQVGSALGSCVGQFFRMNELRVKNFVACGAAAGIAAVFNAPIAGVIFSSEVILRDFGARALSTVVVSAVSASIMSHIFLGESPAFVTPIYHLVSSYEIFLYFVLGILSALAAYAFITALHKSEDLFEAWRIHPWLKPAVGGLLVGLMGLYFPHLFGAGLSTIEEALHGVLDFKILVALIFLKIIATSVSLGSGSSGGVFAPALFIGAVLGGAFGYLVEGHMPFLTASHGAYALVGMASVFAAAAHAPVTAILIVFEMTSDYHIILPIMIAVVTGTAVSQWLHKESIYTFRLTQKGINLGFLNETKVLGAIQVEDAMSPDFEIIPNNAVASDLKERIAHPTNRTLIVVHPKRGPEGIIKAREVQDVFLEGSESGIVARDLATPQPEHCFPDDSLSEAANLMRTYGLTELAVVDPQNPNRVVGVIKSDNIFRTFTEMSLKQAELMNRLEKQDFQREGTVQADFTVKFRSRVAGKQVKEIGLPEEMVIISLRRGSEVMVPRGSTVLQPRDRVWVVMTPDSQKTFKEWLKENNL